MAIGFRMINLRMLPDCSVLICGGDGNQCETALSTFVMVVRCLLAAAVVCYA